MRKDIGEVVCLARLCSDGLARIMLRNLHQLVGDRRVGCIAAARQVSGRWALDFA
jgi:hypothetical protein